MQFRCKNQQHLPDHRSFVSDEGLYYNIIINNNNNNNLWLALRHNTDSALLNPYPANVENRVSS
jgi:hypothetical protein